MTDDRAVSTTLNYVLGLSIALILTTGLLISGGQFVKDQRVDAIRGEMRVLGQQVATDIAMADRLANTTTDNESVEVKRELPDRVGGSSYAISLVGGENPQLLLESDSPEVQVRVNVTNQTDLAMGETDGGTLLVNYTASDRIALEGES